MKIGKNRAEMRKNNVRMRAKKCEKEPRNRALFQCNSKKEVCMRSSKEKNKDDRKPRNERKTQKIDEPEVPMLGLMAEEEHA